MPHPSPAIKTSADALVTLPVRRFSVSTGNPRRARTVEATTLGGARLLGAAILCAQPEFCTVVEIQTRLNGEGRA